MVLSVLFVSMLAAPHGEAHAAGFVVAQTDDDLFGDDDLGDDDLFGDEDLSDDDLIDAEDAAAEDPEPDRPDSSPAAEESRVEEGAVTDAAAPDPAPRPGTLPSSDVEEILIQGQSTGPVVTETDASVTVFSAEDLIALGVEDVSDVARATPNLEIRQADATSASFFIRGVGLTDFSANAASAVAVYQDGVPMNTPPLQLSGIFDVEGLEVARGPQGTGSGRNASAGAIRITSKLPSFENSATFSLGNGSIVSTDAKDAYKLDYEAALETVLVPDVVAARFAFRFREGDAYIRNDCGNAPPLPRAGSVCGEKTAGLNVPVIKEGLQKWIGDERAWSGRGVFRILPPDSDWEMVFIGRGSMLRKDSTVGQGLPANIQSSFIGGRAGTRTGYQDPVSLREQEQLSAKFQAQGLPRAEANIRAGRIVTKNLVEDRPLNRRPFRGDYNLTGTTRLDTYGVTLDLRREFENAAFRSISAFDGWKRYRSADQDMTPDSLFEAVKNRDQDWQVAQELALEGELADHPLRWGVGGNLLAERIHFNGFLRNQSVNPLGGGFNRDYEQDLFSWNAFAQFEVDFWDDYFTLKAGARYNWERKNFDITEQSLIRFDRSSERTWNDPTGTVKLTFHWSDEVDLYWNYSRGWKSGHFNTIGGNEPAQPAEPETIDSHEFGLNGEWWDGRVRASSAFFYYDYNDYQVFNFEDEPLKNPTLEIINANEAEVYGAELELTFEPLLGWAPAAIENLTVELSGGWLQSEYLDFTDEQTAIDAARQQSRIVADFTGNQLASAPEWSFSGYVKWQLDLGAYGTLTPRWDFSWTDDLYFDPTEGRGTLDNRGNTTKPPFTVGQPAYWIHGLRLTWASSNGHLEVAGWCQNLTDERYKTYGFDASRFGGVVINFVGDPRVCGATVGFAW